MYFSEKINLIDEIAMFHPGHDAGLKRGWSSYTGGMVDKGDWDKWKMLKEGNDDDLKACLSELKEEREKAEAWATITIAEHKEAMMEFFEKQENKLLWGIL